MPKPQLPRHTTAVSIPYGNIRLNVARYKGSNDSDDPSEDALVEIEAGGEIFTEQTWPEALAEKYGTWEELESELNFGN